MAALARSGILGGVSRDDLRSVKAELSEVALPAGELLVERGEVADDLYLLLSGRLDVLFESNGDSVPVSTLEPGAAVGEIALLAGDTRACTVRAAEPSDLLRLSGAGLRRVLADHPEAGDELAHQAMVRLRRTRLVEHLTHLFEEIPPDALAIVDELAEWVSLSGGERLFAQGDVGDAVYLVVTGRLRAVSHEPATGQRELGEIRRGELVGEMALLADTTRTATVHAVRDSQLVRFDRSAFDELMARYPRAGLLMAATMIERMSGRRPDRGGKPMSLVVVPAKPEVDLGELMGGLVEALGPDVRRLSSSDVDEHLGVAGIAQIADGELGALRLVRWLEDVEERHQFVVLDVDDGWTPWNRRALRWADRVLVVADATDDPAPTSTERELWELLTDTQHVKLALVLAHPEAAELPSGTARWLEARPVASHHHIRQGDAESHRRLARLVTGSGTGVVLGGGGARGFAHLGVLEAMDDEAVPVDMIAGSSIGAVMAVGPCMGWTAERSRRVALEHFTKLLDYTIPTAALLRGERITAGLRKVLGEVDIADLWIPYFCVSTDLTEARTVFHDRGPLVQAVRASISIPGVLPPVPVDGHLLADGGILDNLPVEEMRRRNPHGRVVAVDVAPAAGPAARRDYGMAISGWRAWRDRRTGSGPPSLLTTLMRSTLVASVRDRDRVVHEEVADLYVDVSVRGGGLLDFSTAAAMASAARSSAAPVLRRWRDGEEHSTAVTIGPGTEQVMMPERSRGGRWAGVLLLTLRDLQLRATRFGAVIGGTAVVLALLFLMTGLVEQFHREPRDTVGALGAGAWIVREGATGAFTSAATMPAGVADEIDPALAPNPVVVARHAIDDDGSSTDIVVVGYRSGGIGAPGLAAGRLPGGPGEIVIDDSSGLGLGDVAVIGARELEVVGLTDRTTLFAGMPVVFMRLVAVQDLVYRGADLASAVLVDSIPASVPDGLTVLEPAAVADDALRPLEGAVSSIALIQGLLWFVAAMIIGTMVYLSALERRRDVAVLKAVGGTTRQLATSMALQGALIALVAALVASALQTVLVPVFPLEVTVPSRSLLQVPLIAVLVSLVAGAFGLRSAVRTDPALAFAGPGS